MYHDNGPKGPLVETCTILQRHINVNTWKPLEIHSKSLFHLYPLDKEGKKKKRTKLNNSHMSNPSSPYVA